MTTDSAKADRLKWLGSNLFLGFLVTALSVFTAVTNYATYNIGNIASDYQTQGDRLLAQSNTESVQATQYIIMDYNMYDGYYINQEKDPATSDYYQSNFSDELKAAIARHDPKGPFDNAYYDDMYTDSNSHFSEAFTKYDLANAASDKQSAYQLSMLIAGVGLAFAAYGALLEEANRLRRVFALRSLILLLISVVQFVMIAASK